jgi:hypothetical protein
MIDIAKSRIDLHDLPNRQGLNIRRHHARIGPQAGSALHFGMLGMFVAIGKSLPRCKAIFVQIATKQARSQVLFTLISASPRRRGTGPIGHPYDYRRVGEAGNRTAQTLARRYDGGATSDTFGKYVR